jgi:hypothetical protein
MCVPGPLLYFNIITTQRSVSGEKHSQRDRFLSEYGLGRADIFKLGGKP